MPAKRMSLPRAKPASGVVEEIQLHLALGPALASSPSMVAAPNRFECLHGVPREVPVPRRGQKCPWLHIGRTKFFHLLKQEVLIPCTVAGLNRSTGYVFGCSVCQAKWGCTCGYYRFLRESRKRGGFT
jgi:hypothetical protein